jgi:putative ABC transport system permease protein
LSPAVVLRLMVREARGSGGKLAFFVACLAVGVAAVVAVAGLSDGVDRAIRAEARPLLAADVAVSAEAPIPDAVAREVDRLSQTRPGTRSVAVRELATVVAVPAPGGGPGPSALVLLKAYGDGYPFYGALTTDPPRPTGAPLDAEGALVAPELAARLGLEAGGVLRIGGQAFTVRGFVLGEPDKVNVSFSLGPRVMISLAGLARTQLEGFGSRVERTLLIKLPDGSGEPEARAVAAVVRASVPEGRRVRVQTFAEAQPSLREGIRRVARFLGLVALVSLILGGIGVAQTVRAWIATRLDAIAVLKCLGARPREIVAVYGAQAVALGLAGSVAGAAAGTALLAAAPRLLTGLLPAVTIDVWQPAAVLRGVVLGTTIALLFSVAPLSVARRVPPLRVLRREAEPLASGRAASVAVAAVLVAGLLVAAYVQVRSTAFAGGFVLGLLVAAAALAGAGRLLTLSVARLAHRRVRVAVRHGLAALVRPGAGTLPALTALGLGVLVVVAIALVERGLGERLRADLPKDAPNVFLVDMQSGQWPQVRSILESSGATNVNSVPIVGARLQSIDGVSTTELAKRAPDEGRQRWILTREQNLTTLGVLPKDNVVVEGALWSDARDEISIEREFARDMGASIGARVVFDVQGVPIELVVTSLRSVEWRSFGINFFLVVEPGVLDDAPQLRVAAARVPAGGEQALQDRLASAVPNVTMLRVREIVEKVTAILDRLGLAVRLLGGFAIVSGVTILAGGIAATAARRGREVAVLKTLGATRHRVVAMFAVEFALIGLVAGVIGTAGGAGLAWGVLTRGMDLEWAWHPAVLAVAPLATGALSVVAGIAACGTALRRRPIEVLRAD